MQDHLDDLATTAAVRATVIAGLGRRPRALPPWLFYDAAGSRLFEAITVLPEYYLTRAEHEIFRDHGPALLAAADLDRDATVVELGAGTATKTATLLGTLAGRGGQVRYVPIDVSASALTVATAQLAAAVPSVAVTPWVLTTAAALPRVAALPTPLAVLFIGSSIGNYDEAEATALLAAVRAAVPVGAALVLGTDLRKPLEQLLPAYDDAQGVTAAFNRNVLVRINRELDADFDPTRFRHVALWNSDRSRVEMHLESRGRQRVRIAAAGLDLDLADGERIHTESSVKYDPAMVERLLATAGFARVHTATDHAARFAVHVARAR